MSIDVLTPAGSAAGSVDLPAEVFDVQVNVPLIHQVVVAQLAAARQGTHDTKTRGEVRGGGRKPYKQKGTGRARQGSTRAPQFTGGGVVHGPTPRSYDQRTPKKMKAAALRGALSDRARNGRVHVVSAVVDGDVPSTRAAVATLASVTERRNVLAVVQREDVVGWKSLRNARGVHVIVVDQLNTYDVLCSDDVVFTSGALEDFVAGPIVTKAPRTVPEAEVPEVAAMGAAPAKRAATSASPTAKPVATEPVKPVAAEPVKPVATEPVKPVAAEPAGSTEEAADVVQAPTAEVSGAEGAAPPATAKRTAAKPRAAAEQAEVEPADASPVEAPARSRAKAAPAATEEKPKAAPTTPKASSAATEEKPKAAPRSRATAAKAADADATDEEATE